MYYVPAVRDKKESQIKSISEDIHYVLNILMILLNILNFVFFFQLVILFYDRWIFLTIYVVHIIFTVYNARYTFNYSRHIIIEGIFLSLSLVITFYALIMFGALLYWIAIAGKDISAEYTVAFIIFNFLFFGIPALETVTFRMLRSDRHSLEKVIYF